MHASVDLGPFAGFDRGDCDRSRGYAPEILKRSIAIFFDSRFSPLTQMALSFLLALLRRGKEKAMEIFEFHSSLVIFCTSSSFLSLSNLTEIILFKIVKNNS